MLEYAERKKVRLISREIDKKISRLPRISTYMTTMPQRYRQADGQTDEQLGTVVGLPLSS